MPTGRQIRDGGGTSRVSGARRPGRPATGVTPARSVRVGEVWDAAKAKAERNGETITEVIQRKLQEYIDEQGEQTAA